ncbi:MAG TPA: hypothetical protein VJ932_08020, partial [Alkalispirochaeta sp.]|nr:hypothetical protein [Alkalispirochaeta sp.]
MAAGFTAVGAGGAAEEETRRRRADLLSDLSEENPVYSVAIAAVVAPETTDRQRSTLSSYAEVLRDLATGPPTRYLENAERRAVAEERITTRRREILRQIDDRRAALERARLERTSTSSATDIEREADDDSLQDLRERLDLLTSISPADVAIPREIPIAIADESHRVRRVLPTPEGLSRELPEVDLILYLVVVPVGDRLLVRVHAYEVRQELDRELFRLVDT